MLKILLITLVSIVATLAIGFVGLAVWSTVMLRRHIRFRRYCMALSRRMPL